MTGAGLLHQDGGFALTEAGMDWLTTAVGVEPGRLRAGRRPLVRSCVDWTERRVHLGGAAGAELCRCFLDRQWVRRVRGSRAVRLTPAGEPALRTLLPSVDLE
jgi:hypothetical protein